MKRVFGTVRMLLPEDVEYGELKKEEPSEDASQTADVTTEDGSEGNS